MRRWTFTAMLAAGPMLAQEPGPIGILRGDLVAWSGTSRAGLLTFRTADARLLNCAFDDRTWFERGNERLAISGMREGDHLELVTDRTGAAACYARTVQIVDVVRARKTVSGRPALRIQISATERWAPRGDMTFAGIVMGMDGNWLTIRTRDKDTHVLLLRPDTRYLSSGIPGERSSLEPQTRVFVRAGRNLDGDIEAYTIVWGDILEVQD